MLQFELREHPVEARVFSWDEVDRSRESLALMGVIKDYSPLFEFPNLRRLWVSQANPVQLDLIGQLTRLEFLSIWWLRSIRDLGPLANLTNLTSLHISGTISGVSLEPLARLTGLRKLAIAANMSTVANMGHLKVPTLAPLARPAQLEYFELFGIRPADRTLEQLTKLQSLKKLDIMNDFPVEETARLAGRPPNTEGFFREPYFEGRENDDFLRCKKCGVRQRVVRIGRARPHFLCPDCDRAKLQEHLENYERLKREFAGQG